MSRAAAFIAGLVAIAALLTLWLIDPFAGPIPKPLMPDLTGVEPQVSEKLKKLHDAVLASPDAESWGHYARALQAHDMRNEARHAYLVVAEKLTGPDRFEPLYLAGTAVVRSEPEEARALFERALAVRDDYAPLHVRLGQLHERAGRVEPALLHYERARELQESSHAYLGLGRLALTAGQTDVAIVHLEKAATLNRNHREVQAALAQAYRRAGKEQDAAAAGRRAGNLSVSSRILDPITERMAREGVSFTNLEQLALASLKGGDPNAALKYINGALDIHPDGLDALFHKGRILASLGRFEEASATFDRVLSVRPDDVDSLVLKAACLIKLQQPRDALALSLRAFELDPNHLNARYNLGLLLRRSRPEMAAEHLRFMLERDPYRNDARIALASIYATQQRRDEAEKELRTVLEQDPRNATARALLRKLQ